MNESRLAIITTDPETGQVLILNDHGPCTNDEFIQAYAVAYAAQTDWDITLNAMLAVIVNEHFLTDAGLTTNGYTVGSVLQFIQDNIDEFLPPGKKTVTTRVFISLLEPAIKMFPKGKKLELNWQEIKELMTSLQEPFMRQLLRDADRRNIVRPAMPALVMLYENPPSDN